MEWASISPLEGLSRLKRGARAVDVRSPGEFALGSIPGFANIPILHNEHRHEVGLAYKKKGQDQAISLGMSLVEPLKAGLIKGWQDELSSVQPESRLLICWRGGLRSKIAASWLAEQGLEGVRVSGGYKALRGELLSRLECLPEFVVLGGMTGSGKTDLLRELPAEFVLDLERNANHRGSSFGLKINSVQPHQQTFENASLLALFGGPALMAVESESRMVGSCVVPAQLKAAMDRSPMILLDSPMEERVGRIFAEYVKAPLLAASRSDVRMHLGAALERVQRRLGGLRFQAIRTQLADAFSRSDMTLENHAPWIESLLREYYDPLYEHSLAANERTVLFRGGYGPVKDFLADRLSRRRA